MQFDWWDILSRVALAFLLVLLATRTLGKKMLQGLSYLDFMASITLGALTGAIVLDHNLTIADLILAISSFTGLVLIMSFFQLKIRRVRRLLSGLPLEVIHDGKILERELRKSRMTMELLMQQLRIQGVFNIEDVKQAYLETNGKLSVLLRPQALPLTLGDFLSPDPRLPEQRHPVELIVDGEVLTHNLERWGFNLAWLLQELERQGARDSADVAYAILTSQNKLYVDLYRDDLQM
ncbi:DUF421 domain-containing protein [Tumebacillus sp. ITR2]|uniref:DUF421 domain-containing protein n=1 Tax=Tumebacillus amylolyticus TaxID=2801339 RepID=A0ABS1J4U9_9BACL|nr:DUF421 domain-containing protein [Tumebacillus amylolyticus]MBL0385205.1 DUF421 domain-containing protein [Tumebacillus amylolyticus]